MPAPWPPIVHLSRPARPRRWIRPVRKSPRRSPGNRPGRPERPRPVWGTAPAGSVPIVHLRGRSLATDAEFGADLGGDGLPVIDTPQVVLAGGLRSCGAPRRCPPPSAGARTRPARPAGPHPSDRAAQRHPHSSNTYSILQAGTLKPPSRNRQPVDEFGSGDNYAPKPGGISRLDPVRHAGPVLAHRERGHDPADHGQRQHHHPVMQFLIGAQ